MTFPASESRPTTRPALGPSAPRAWYVRTIRWLVYRRSWYSVIFPVGFASLARAILVITGAADSLALSCVAYTAAVIGGLGVASVMERTSNLHLPRALSAAVGSVGFLIAGLAGAGTGRVGGTGVVVTVYTLVAVSNSLRLINRRTERRTGQNRRRPQSAGRAAIPAQPTASGAAPHRPLGHPDALRGQRHLLPRQRPRLTELDQPTDGGLTQRALRATTCQRSLPLIRPE